VAVCVLRVEGDATASETVRVEELEVRAAEIASPRVRRFLAACGVAPEEIDSVLQAARGRAGGDRSIVLRVRLARDRSGVDILPASQAGVPAAVASLDPARVAER
jgi:hypothetical protein